MTSCWALGTETGERKQKAQRIDRPRMANHPRTSVAVWIRLHPRSR